MEDQKGKDLFYSFPNIKVSANCPSAEQNKGPGAPKAAAKNDASKEYSCPVYKYPMRSDKYLITIFNVRAEPPQDNQKPRKDQAQTKELS